MRTKNVSVLVSAFLFSLTISFCVNGDEQPPKVSYERMGRRDPFVRLVGTGSGEWKKSEMNGTGDVSLEGIIWDPKGSSMVIVNGEILMEGQQYQNLKIVKIEKEKILILLNNEKECTISLTQ